MEFFDAKISAKGKVTIPLELRRGIGLEAGGMVQFRVEADGRVFVLAKKRSIKALKGLVAAPHAVVNVKVAVSSDVAERNRTGEGI
jgi:AbrB family looped-hinge helix DNA binding protein